MEEFNEKDAKETLEKNYSKAEKLLKDGEKTERFLQRLEKKLKVIPVAGNTLAMVPTLVSLVRNYIKKEYTEAPIGTIIAIVSALIYVLSPADAIPDFIPGVGYVDDALVIAACLKLIDSDLKEYQRWREKNNKMLKIDYME